MIRVLVVDDHPVVRAGLVGMLELEADLHVVAEAADGVEALKRLASEPTSCAPSRPARPAYLLKDTPREQLLAGVRAAAQGQSVLAPSVAAALVQRVREPAEDVPTPRELQVLAGVARGLTNAEIGRELFIGEATVKTHLLRVFGKLGVDDRTRAVTAAMERGLLPRPGAR